MAKPVGYALLLHYGDGVFMREIHEYHGLFETSSDAMKAAQSLENEFAELFGRDSRKLQWHEYLDGAGGWALTKSAEWTIRPEYVEKGE